MKIIKSVMIGVAMIGVTIIRANRVNRVLGALMALISPHPGQL